MTRGYKSEYRKRKSKCSKCGKRPHAKGRRYCNVCHAAYMRDWRKNNPLSEEHRIRDKSRSFSRMLYVRGILEKTDCKRCGSKKNLERHHHDYSKPREIVWLCKDCHQKVTNGETSSRFKKSDFAKLNYKRCPNGYGEGRGYKKTVCSLLSD